MLGHGGKDVGASSENRYEKDDTLKIAKLVEKHLEGYKSKKKIKVIMTREKDKAISLQDRCKFANKKKANLFVSIHRNIADTGNGIEIWANSQKRESDTKLAETILEKLEKTNIQSNRGVKYGTIKSEDSNYYVLNNTNMPSCLIELGFISNDKDNKLLDENIDEYAKAIAEGIIENINKELK